MKKKHVLMITNHGIHEWEARPGLPDTGGQNVYVNELTKTLAELGYRVTVANRGGFPHPETGEMQTGIRDRDENRRIVYLEDSSDEFIPKEKMKPMVPELSDFLLSYLKKENEEIDLIISHYWDGALLGTMVNRGLAESVPHIWVPHSLGEIKKRNVPEKRWEDLRINERIETEQKMIDEFDHLVATSALIRNSLKEDYGREASLFLPPCIRPDRFYPREVSSDDEIWNFLSEASGASEDVMRNARFIIEISRTDRTKQKDVLLKALAKLIEKSGYDDLYLILSLEEHDEKLYGELQDLIESLEIRDKVIALGYEHDRLPILYAASSVYCSPSIMEGFGMSVQEAAAAALPAAVSRHVPFVNEYLGASSKEEGYKTRDMGSFTVGPGAIIVHEQKPDAYAEGLSWMLENKSELEAMGRRALEITIPAFTWKDSTLRLLNKMGFGDDS